MINGVNEMNDRVNGITSNTTNSLSNIMSDLKSIVKIGVRIMWDECKIHGRMVKRFLNDEDVSRPMGLTKVDTGMNQEYRLQERSSSQEYVGYERNRYGFPRHFPKDMVSS